MSDASTFMSNLGIPIISGLFNNDNQDQLQNELQNVLKGTQDYRRDVAGARQRQLAAQLSAFAPVNQMLGDITGGAYQAPNAAYYQQQLKAASDPLFGLTPQAVPGEAGLTRGLGPGAAVNAPPLQYSGTIRDDTEMRKTYR